MKKIFIIYFLCLIPIICRGISLHTEQHIELDGRKIYVAVEADDDSAPVLLILPYGPAGNCEYLKKGLGKELKKRFTVVYMEPYGGARSPINTTTVIFDRSPVKGLNADVLANDIGRIMENLGYDTFGILGHDFGAFIGLLYASSHPDSIDFFIAVNPRFDYRGGIRHSMIEMGGFFKRRAASSGVSASAILDERKSDILKGLSEKRILDGQAMERFFELFKEADGGLPFPKDLIFLKKKNKIIKKLLREPLFLQPFNEYGYFAFIYSDDYYERDLTPALAAMNGNTTIIITTENGPFVYPYQIEEILRRLPEAVIRTFPGSSFYPMLEYPDSFLSILDSLLDSIDL